MPFLRRINSQSTMPTSSQQPQQTNQQVTMTTMTTMAAVASDESSTNTSLDNTMVSLSLIQRRNNKAATTSIVGGASRRGMSVLDKHNNELMQMQNATIQNVPSNKRAMSNKENTLNVLMVRYQEQSLYIHYTCHLAIYLHTVFMI